MFWFDLAWSGALIVLVPALVLSLTQILRSDALTTFGAIGWMLLVIFVPFVGVALWFALRPSRIITRTG